MTHPIPDEALDDRLAVVGTAGSGKTYATLGAVERILDLGGRVIIPDPLGVCYGLRLLANGKPSKYNVVIFGGPHGDLPINEHVGALIGETVAGMAESAIIDLSDFGTKASERRFMLAFLTALYRKANNEPVHLIFDEADMWAPQTLLDKDGDAARLLGMMETVVRRGRIKGFIPWLVTQRPAVLSKNVLSQADGLVALKLTSSQDRNAIGAWVEGQADKAEWARIHASLATMQRGQGIVWVPSRGILETATFPIRRTFDSSRTPKRGETVNRVDLTPLDLGVLKERMATVEADAKANDPKLLKIEIARLTKELASKQGEKINTPDLQAIETARREGRAEGEKAAASSLTDSINRKDAAIAQAVGNAIAALHSIEVVLGHAIPKPEIQYTKPAAVAQSVERHASNVKVASSNLAGRSKPITQTDPGETMPGPQRKLLTVLAQYPSGRNKKQLAILAGYSHNGGAFNNPLANLRSRGWAEGGLDRICITEAGIAALGAYEPLPTGAALREYWFGNLDGPPAKLLRALCEAYPAGMSKTDLAAACGYQPTGGAFNNPLARLRSLELATGKGGAEIRASDDLFGDM